MKYLFSVTLGLTLLLNSSYSNAQSAVGYDFLRTFVGARPSAMAGAFVGVVGDIHSMAYNPAGLTGIKENRATLSYLNHLLDFNSGFIAFAKPFRKGAVGASLNFVDFGNFERRGENNEDIGEFGSNGLTLSLSYAQKFVENLSFGGTAKYIRFQIDEFTASAVGFDFGAVYEVQGRALNIGLSVLNVGSTTSAFIETKDDLPMSVQLGASKVLEHLPVMVSAALVKYKDESIDFRVGGEIYLTEQLHARLGYNSVGQEQKVETSLDRFAGVSFGLGFKVDKFDVDYSLSSFGEVGSLNRFTLIGRF